MAIPDPILRVSAYLDGELIAVDLLGPHSGIQLEDPYWQPAIATPKGGGAYVESSLAPGRRLTGAEDGNVIETIPLSVRGRDQDGAIRTLRELLQLLRQGRDYWTEPWEYGDIWLEARPACNDCFTGYARIVQANIDSMGNVFGQPFFSALNPEAVLEGITLILEREPYWRALPPGEMIGPLYNLLKNPDFELWNFGVADSQPDSWTDLESVGITGSNNRQDTAVQYGRYALRIEVRQSTGANQVKGMTQTAESTRDRTTYTMLAWVRSDGVGNGVGRLLVTSNLGTYEVYRGALAHGWRLYTQVFSTGTDDVVGVHAEILTTAANCDGTLYFDGLMLVEGDWEQEAVDGLLPWMSSSHVVNHWDQPESARVEAGDINFVDAWNVPGDVPALVRLEVMNNTPIANELAIVERFPTMRVGQRRLGDVFNFDNYFDPPGIVNVDASSDDDVGVTNVGDAWRDVASQLISSQTRDNEGRFRVLARVYDERFHPQTTIANLQVRLRYWVGSANVNLKTLEAVPVPSQGDQWVILNLTPNAAMVQEAKFRPDALAGLGYTIQFRRPVGTDIARLDYVLTMPTDGGYLEASIDPPLTQGNMLIADNTASLSISGTARRAGWFREYVLPGTTPRAYRLCTYKGRLYAGGSIQPGANANPIIWRRSAAGVWSQVYTDATGPSRIYDFAVYEGVLYAAASQGGGTGIILSSTDGITWAVAHTMINANTIARALEAFNGYLWAFTSTAAGTAYVERYDGSAWAVQRVDVGGGYYDAEVYGGRLYALSAINAVDVYDPVADAWTSNVYVSGGSLYILHAGLGHLFVGGSSAAVVGEVTVFDGETWTAYDVAGTDVYSLTDLNDVLYAPVQSGLLYQSEDLARTWALAYASPDVPAFAAGSVFVFQSQLYFVAQSTGDVNVLADEDVAYQVADFQGGAFTAPNRRLPGNPRRHRWFFSYDREDYVNDLDDKVLVGIGYVPRYLTLRGRD